MSGFNINTFWKSRYSMYSSIIEDEHPVERLSRGRSPGFTLTSFMFFDKMKNPSMLSIDRILSPLKRHSYPRPKTQSEGNVIVKRLLRKKRASCQKAWSVDDKRRYIAVK